jgi:hypothetical protein
MASETHTAARRTTIAAAVAGVRLLTSYRRSWLPKDVVAGLVLAALPRAPLLAALALIAVSLRFVDGLWWVDSAAALIIAVLLAGEGGRALLISRPWEKPPLMAP